MKSQIFTRSALLLLLTACSPEKSAQNFAPDTPPSPPVVRKLEVELDEIREPQGCLNLTRLFEKIQATPEGTLVREVTRNLKLEKSSQSAPRELFVRGLALKSFVFNQMTAPDFSGVRPRFEQVACEKIISHATFGAPTEAKIEKWDETGIQIAFASRREIYRLNGPTELEIVRQGRALDDCSRQEKIYPLQVSTVVRWGTRETLEALDETIGLKYLNLFSEALNELPIDLGSALRAPFIDDDGLEVAALSPTLLATLAATEETVQTKRCSELPVATPTPAPTPRPQAPKPRSIIDIFFDWFW